MFGNNAYHLYQHCLAAKPSVEWCASFKDMVDACCPSPASRAAVVNVVAIRIATRFLDRQETFHDMDRAINNLAGYALRYDNRPDLMWQIYLAFDAAEADANATSAQGVASYDRLTRPALTRLLAPAASEKSVKLRANARR